jgi:hypothetical protein
MIITWKIDWMKCLPQSAVITDYVIQCGWRCNGSQDQYRASVYGSASFQIPDDPSNDLTPYEDLTQEQVLTWCWASGVDKTATEESVQTQIQNQINPPIVELPLPWVKN